ncbi:MAG: hypothetical protein JO063_13765 [Pseudonocardiales bacterium]|nr:hypothetical protein [Pseudonocardiales bacterium]MBV9031352.1 hypothetical protein [Pseudonocardiales bacterium]MBW0011155.1 hypothetical protein [Pseudonocardiales bacterium]
MIRTLAARPVRLLTGACLVGAAFAVVDDGLGLVVTPPAVAVLLPFMAAAVSATGLTLALPRIDRLVHGLAHRSITTPYAALAHTAARIQAGSLDESLPGLARVLAEGTGAARAVVWLAVEDELVSAASYPAVESAQPHSLANLAALLAQPDVDHVVPVLDGSVLRAALAIGKPGLAVTPADKRLMHDVADGAGLLLRGVQLNAELHQRVRRADELATELQASRQRLTRARDVERRRLIAELTQVTTDRLAALRTELAQAKDHLSGGTPQAEHAQQALERARTGLDELLERFRVIARGVHPAVLRDQGPYGALDELATELPRPVRLSGTLSRRLAWEVESGIYFLAASAMQHLVGRPAEQPLQVHLEHAQGRLAVRIDDPALITPAEGVLAALTDDVDRLAALGGDVEFAEHGARGAVLRAWLPDQLEPPVDDVTQARSSSVGSGQVAP